MSVRDKLQTRLDKMEDPEKDLQDAVNKFRNPRTEKTKIIKAASGNAAAIAVSPRVIDLSAPESAESGEPLGLTIIGGMGTVVKGPVAFTATPGEMRIGGMWKFNNLLLSAAPSTMLTPIPVLRFSLPLEGVARFAKNATIIAALAGVL